MALVHHRRPRPVPEAERRAAVYARVSKVDDPKTASLDSQTEGGIQIALGCGLPRDRIDTFSERFTGEELEYRQVLSAIREAIRQGRYQFLICYCLDRLARDPLDQGIVIKEARQYGCEVLFVTETYENSEGGDLLRYVKGYAAKLEIASIKDRTRRGLMTVMQRGGLTQQGYPPYGYLYTQAERKASDRTVRALILDPDTAAVVRRIFHLIAVEGWSAQAVARILNVEGVPPPRAARGHTRRDGTGFRWHGSAVRHILKNASYQGTDCQDYGKTRCQGINRQGHSVSVPRPPAEWQRFPLTEPTPAIVDPRVWELANRVFRQRQAGAAQTWNQHHPRLLRGLIFCGVCGHPMYTAVVTRKRSRPGQSSAYYQCGSPRTKTLGGARCGGRATPGPWVEDLVSARLAEWCLTPGRLRQELEKSRRQTSDPQLIADLASLQTERQQQERLLKAASTAWSKAVERGDEDQATIFAEHLSLASMKLKMYREKEAALQGRMQTALQARAALDAIETVLARGGTALAAGNLTFEEKRSLLEGLQVRIIANGRLAEMHFVNPDNSRSTTVRMCEVLVVELKEDARSRHQ